jgi:hypothetical protein
LIDLHRVVVGDRPMSHQGKARGARVIAKIETKDRYGGRQSI